VIAVAPEPLSTTEDLEAPIRIQYNERISERPSAGVLGDAVLLSPLTPDARVRHRGEALEVELPNGLRPGVVYRVTVQAVVRDLFGNTAREPFEFVFSTGGALSPSAVVGLVVDRVTGRPTRDVTVHAVDQASTEDPPIVHVARTDTGGVYVLRYLPAGPYSVIGFLDRNRNRAVDTLEVQGGQTIELGATDTLFANFPLIEPDTTAATLTRAEALEPALVRLTFGDYLDPEVSLAQVGATLERVDGGGGAPEVSQLLHEHRFVALRREAAQALADTSAAADTTAAAPRPPQAPAVNFVGRAQGGDSTSLGVLGLTLPSRVVYAELSDSLLTAVEYVLRIQGVQNVAGLTSAIDTIRVSMPAPPGTPPPPGGRRR
jgi:hypothetical protein